MTQVPHRRISVLAILFFISLCSAAHAQTISLALEPHFFADDTEYVSPYTKSETLMGSSLKTYFTFRQTRGLTLKLGLYGLLYYGDEAFLSDVKPLASYSVSIDEAFVFTMGWLDNERRHQMLDALQWERLEYTRQIDYGFQVKLINPYSSLDLWVNWNLLNTPEHKEYLDGAVNIFVYMWKFAFNMQRYWSHHGGHLFSSGTITSNYSLALGLDNFYDLEGSVLRRMGWRAYYLAYDDGGTLTSWKGNGALGELYTSLARFRIYLDYWYGNGFLTEEGNPLYRHGGWVFCGVRSETKVFDKANFVFELRVHYFTDTRVSGAQGRLELKSSFGYPVLE